MKPPITVATTGENRIQITEKKTRETLHYGGAEKIIDESISEEIQNADPFLANSKIETIYQLNFQHAEHVFYGGLVSDLFKGEQGWDLYIFSKNSNGEIHRYSFSPGTLPYFEYYDWLRYGSKIPGDWIECGFVGDFNVDKENELLIFAATGMGFFMRIYDYDEESDNFRKTFEEKFTMLSSKPVQYGELNGERGFIITYYDDDKYKPKNPDIIQRAFFAWDGSKREYVFKGEYTGNIE